MKERATTSEDKWGDHVRAFYTALPAPVSKESDQYNKTSLPQKAGESSRMDYINMAHDVLSDLYKKKSGT